MTETPDPMATPDFLAGGGEMGERIARFDWAPTAMGPIAAWPAHIRAVLSLILRSPVPIVTLWMEDGVMIYNDAYSLFAGGRHPALLGSKVREGWPEVAEFNDKVMRVGLGGGTLAFRDQELTLSRNGRPEPVWMNLDYSPILDDRGRPVGVVAIVVETTAKVRAERWLRGERERLRDLFEQAPGFFALLTGPEHVFDLANPAYLRLVGNRDILGRRVADALPEIAGQGFLDILGRVYAGGEPYSAIAAPVLLETRRGEPLETRFLDFVYQPVLDPAGSVTGIVVQGMDVTERVAAANAVRESEERFRLLAESAPVMLWISNETGRCLYLNKPLRAFWGTGEDYDAFDWTATVHPEDRAALADPFEAGMRTRTGFDVTVRYRRADGAYRSLQTTALPRFNADGGFLGMIGVNIDVTEARQAEAALRQETRLLEILNRTGAAIAAELDLERIVQTVTDAGVELTGAEVGAFFYNATDEGGQVYRLYSLSGVPKARFEGFAMPRVTALFRPTYQGEGTVRLDDVRAHPDYGRQPPFFGMPEGHVPVRSYLAVPVTSRGGEVIGGLLFGHAEPGRFKPEHETLLSGIAGQAAVAIDNARLFLAAERENQSRAKAEEQLRALNETLEGRVLAEIAERRQAEAALLQAQKMEAIGQLTGGVAHDFNNLLQVISGNLQLLGRDVAGNRRAEDRVANALSGVSRGAKLASQLLAFGRRQALEPRTLNIGRLVAGMDEMLRRTLGETIEIETIVSGGLWNTFVDPAQTENAILNLAINARDAMENGGKLTIEVGNAYVDDVYVRNFPEAAAGQYVVLSVTDTGTGMPPDILEKAFEPFFSTKSEGKGTGLGLSMVYGFVRQSGGHVRLYSEVEHGTTVKLYLPRVMAEEDHRPGFDTAGPVLGGSETILVAEDDEGVRDTAVALLSELGYRVLKARDASAALTVIESGAPIDLLFTDVVMPGPLKSPELARKVRQSYPQIAVLFTSGYTENSIVHGGKLDAGVELLSKPYTREALARKVRQVLAQRREGQSGPAPQPAPAAAPPAEPAAPVGEKPLKILVVEDEWLIRQGLLDMLDELGHAVFEAGTMAEGEAVLDREAPDVLVTDLGLPDGDGADLARRARAARPDLAIVLATGDPQAAHQSGVEPIAVLSKPHTEVMLIQAIAAARQAVGKG